jgi:hypothetical protein
MNNFHDLRDDGEGIAPASPTIILRSTLRSRPEALSAAISASHQHAPRPASAQPPIRKTTYKFLINGRIIRNRRNPLKTNNRTRF